jgi:hypothetical protein
MLSGHPKFFVMIKLNISGKEFSIILYFYNREKLDN